MIRRHVIVGIAAAAFAAMLVGIGAVDVTRAAVLVIVVLAVSLILGMLPGTDPGWPRPPAEDRPGGRKDLSELAWAALTRDGHVAERVLRRVRRIAARRLADHGIVWDGRLGDGLDGWGRDERDAATHHTRAAALLGAETFTGLTTARAVSPRTLQTWFRVLDRLVETPDDARSHR
ncbi:hypothetical protein Xcel_1786 [Xylanimonas cellulosilytica DSM 15894]|uniref:Uncharacterized protein n=1 Tax=Xylanimonas cellulosilytica (strain DSM 15894 / JCM 12276 / CECT 5975 / KCTC 9989 / LMG 20990 / NBRC 107835 / XIL07) TaxID=446471 RepID=D1BSW4_XYLCX|nr:hypothetical protein [Xylanimonas cellulosilytica]ACZ30806.1 hypothetical protein Xcel_1786 [Xylanimonas cellulosilytica DSM 15894]